MACGSFQCKGPTHLQIFCPRLHALVQSFSLGFSFSGIPGVFPSSAVYSHSSYPPSSVSSVYSGSGGSQAFYPSSVLYSHSSYPLMLSSVDTGFGGIPATFSSPVVSSLVDTGFGVVSSLVDTGFGALSTIYSSPVVNTGFGGILTIYSSPVVSSLVDTGLSGTKAAWTGPLYPPEYVLQPWDFGDYDYGTLDPLFGNSSEEVHSSQPPGSRDL